MIKLLGILFILLSAYTSGHVLCGAERLKLAQFSEIACLMRRVQSEIALCRKPTEKIFAEIPSYTPLLQSYGFYEILCPKDTPFRLRGEEALSEVRSRFLMGGEAFSLFSDFILAVGKSDCGYQLRELEHLTAEFERAAADAKENADRNMRLKKITPYFFGAILAIILI